MVSAKQNVENDMMQGLGAAPRIDIPEYNPGKAGGLGKAGLSNDLMNEQVQLRGEVEQLYDQVEELQDKQQAAMARVEIMSAQIRSVAQLLSMFVEGLQQQAKRENEEFEIDDMYDADSSTTMMGHQIMGGVDGEQSHLSLDAFEIGEQPEILSDAPEAVLFSKAATVKAKTLKEEAVQEQVAAMPEKVAPKEAAAEEERLREMAAPAA